MADALDNLLTLNIVAQTAGITRRGFGTTLIAAYHENWPERVRAYTNPADMLADGFTAGHQAYVAASKLMSQVPAPPRFLVGRLAETPNAHVETLTPTAVEGVTYVIELTDQDGVLVEYEYTAESGDDAEDICDAFRSAINGGTQNITGTGTATLILTADNAGEVFGLYAGDDGTGHLWARVNGTTDPGMATDLAAIRAADDTWFGLLVDNQSQAIVNATAGWAETNRKLFGFTTGDSAAKTGAAGSGDVLDDQEVASRGFTFGAYSPRPHDHVAAGWMGRMLPLTPGSATWAYKTLRNVSTAQLSATHRANIEAKKGNWYIEVAGKAITFPGTTGLDFIDVTVTIEWLKARVQEDLFDLITRADKVPFTDKGIAAVEARIRGVWAEGIANGALNDDLVVVVPDAVDVSPGDRSARVLTGVSFSGTLAGAIHKLTINATVSA